MGDRAAKDALFTEFATVGKALGSPKRLELLDLLAQGPRSVEDLSGAAELPLSTCSAHLQTLREAGLVRTRRQRTRIFYSLAGTDVAALLGGVRAVASAHRPSTDVAARDYLGPSDTEQVSRADLLRRASAGDVVVLDVRPMTEYASGHLPGSVHIPLDELAARLDELPLDRQVVAYCRGSYCVLAHDAVRLLTARGRRAARSSDGVLEWRVDGVALETGAA